MSTAEVPTIFALSSAPGRAGVAVFRVSGPAAGEVLDSVAPPRPEPRVASVRRFAHPMTGAPLDRGLALWFPASASFTGEDVVELHTHGGRAVIAAMIAALGAVPGCRLAEPGEFARRAFENGKIDLAEAEGLADLIDAETEAQRRNAVHHASGALSALYEGWRKEVIEAAALVEAAIDFSDEGDVSVVAIIEAEAAARGLARDIARHLKDGHRGEILNAGFRVVIAGPPNAGKSSLLNTLARRDVAIVSEEAGTTRDVIEVRLDLDGLPVALSDTAGIRDAAGLVEQEGVRRALARARDADLVVWMTEAVAPPVEVAEEVARSSPNILRVWSKCDLLEARQREQGLGIIDVMKGGETNAFEAEETKGAGDVSLVSRETSHDAPAHKLAGSRPPLGVSSATAGTQVKARQETGWGKARSKDQGVGDLGSRLRGNDAEFGANGLAISVKTAEGLDRLIGAITNVARARMGTGEEPAIAHARHREQLERALAALTAFLADTDRGLELRAEDLRLAATALGRITGRVDPEEVLGQVFQRFCIGK